MSVQTIGTDFWEIHLPEDWMHQDPGIEAVNYFEAPDQREGVYLSLWRDTSRPLLAAMLHARDVDLRTLPRVEAGEWEVLQAIETEGEANTEVVTEYFNRDAGYRIVSRMLGRVDCYVRLKYHDYACADLKTSRERSEPWIRSLRLLDGNPE